MTGGDKEGAATSSVVRGRTMERRLYIFRVRIERLDDPTIHSAPSPLLLCEAPVAFRAITFEIPTPLPPTLSVARSTAIDNSAAIHSNSDRDLENYNKTMSQSTTTMLGNAANLNGSVIGGKFDILPFPIDPHGHFGEFLEELEHRVAVGWQPDRKHSSEFLQVVATTAVEAVAGAEVIADADGIGGGGAEWDEFWDQASEIGSQTNPSYMIHVWIGGNMGKGVH